MGRPWPGLNCSSPDVSFTKPWLTGFSYCTTKNDFVTSLDIYQLVLSCLDALSKRSVDFQLPDHHVAPVRAHQLYCRRCACEDISGVLMSGAGESELLGSSAMDWKHSRPSKLSRLGYLWPARCLVLMHRI